MNRYLQEQLKDAMSRAQHTNRKENFDRARGTWDSDDGELKGIIGIHIDDFLIGLADGDKSEKWMSEIKSLYLTLTF